MAAAQDHKYPDTMKVTLPDSFLLAIGKVCAQWNALESIVDLAIRKFAGIPDTDVRGLILVTHMTWPLKMDILSALVDALDPKDYPWLKRFGEVSPLLKKAQEVRNKYVHARWGMGDLSEPLLLRATARGERKLRMEKVTASEIEAAAVDVGRAAIALWKFMVNRM